MYVDQYPGWLGVPKKWEGGGHLMTNDLTELHRFAQSIGLKRQWFQDKTFPHYDLTKGKRAMALRYRAVPIHSGEFPDDLLVKRGDGYERYDARKARHA